MVPKQPLPTRFGDYEIILRLLLVRKSATAATGTGSSKLFCYSLNGTDPKELDLASGISVSLLHRKVKASKSSD